MYVEYIDCPFPKIIPPKTDIHIKDMKCFSLICGACNLDGLLAIKITSLTNKVKIGSDTNLLLGYSCPVMKILSAKTSNPTNS